MIKAVLFDYGGVLSIGGKNFKHSLAELLGLDVDDSKLDDLKNDKIWTGDVSSQDYFAEVSRKLQQEVTVEDFLKASQITQQSKPVYQLAIKLRQAGLKTAILSNMYESSADMLRQAGLYDGFDPVVLSYQEGIAKPDPLVYQRAVQKLGCQPSEVLFIDDQQRFIEPAQALGMETIQAHSEEQIVADTKALIKKENGIEL